MSEKNRIGTGIEIEDTSDRYSQVRTPCPSAQNCTDADTVDESDVEPHRIKPTVPSLNRNLSGILLPRRAPS